MTSDQKKPGCIKFLIGCMAILAILCFFMVGSFVYFYKMDKDIILGGIAIKMLQNQAIHIDLTTEMNQNQNIASDEKVALKISYDKFLSDYDNFPKDKQEKIKKYFGVLIKKFINNPTFLQTEPPPEELKELVKILVPNQELFIDNK